jgi:hypothetical protein
LDDPRSDAQPTEPPPPRDFGNWCGKSALGRGFAATVAELSRARLVAAGDCGGVAGAGSVPGAMGSLIKKRRKRMRKKKHKKMLKRTRFQRRNK